MRQNRVPLGWACIWIFCISFGILLSVMYDRLPADGSTGDLSSFGPEGYTVKWLLERRDGGLLPGDIIVSVQDKTVDGWLTSSSKIGKNELDGSLTYAVIRDGVPFELSIKLRPVALSSVLARWIPQLIIAAFLLTIGTFVFLKKPREKSAQLLLTFCVLIALQFWGDAYNMQYTALIWRHAFWMQLFTEHVIYSLGVSTVIYFALIFPVSAPIVRRFPRLVPISLYSFPILAVVVSMAISPNWTEAIASGNRVSWIAAILLASMSIAAMAYSAIKASEPVAKAQVRWIIWCASVEMVFAIPLYVVPLMLNLKPVIPHPVLMMSLAIVPATLGVSILRYRLFDINIIINRTLVFGTLTGLLIGVYFALVRVFTELVQLLLGSSNDSLVIFFSTVSIAIAFSPLRKRVQNIIDRVFYKTKLDHSRLLNEMSERLTTRIVLEDISLLLGFELPRQLQIAMADVAVLDRERHEYVLVNDPGRRFLPETSPAVVQLQSQKYVLRLGPPSGISDSTLTFLGSQNIELCIPLIVGKKTVGFYLLGAKLSGDAYSADEIQLLRLLGKQAGVAVENSRLFRAESDQRKFAQALVEASSALGSTLDIDELLDHILIQVERVIAGDAISIVMVEQETATVVRMRRSRDPAGSFLKNHVSLKVSEDPTLTELAEKRSPIYTEDLTDGSRWIPKSAAGSFHALAAAPIIIDGRFSGAIVVYSSDRGNLSIETSLKLSAFASHAATAITNAELWSQSQNEIVERMKTEEQIKASLEEKNVLLQEVHHRVKNNLQVISSLLTLQSNQIEDEDTAVILRDSQVRIQSIALVHESLYRSKNFSQIGMGDYIRGLADQVFESFHNESLAVSMRYAIDDVEVGIIQAVPCGLILNELITNSLKHAFPGNSSGEIFVELSSLGGSKLCLVVGDNGIGMPFSSKDGKPDSLGLQIVNTLVDQLDGSIDLDTSNGVVFTISFSRNDRQNST